LNEETVGESIRRHERWLEEQEQAQARFGAWLEEQQAAQAAHRADMQEMREKMKDTDKRLDSLTSVAASLVLTAQAQTASIEELRSQWRETLDRFEAFLRGRGGDGGPAKEP
jgi:hypothetical protein